MIKIKKVLLSGLFLIALNAWSGQLAIVIDDFGYRQHNELALIDLSPNITVSVLPHAGNAQRIATHAHQHGNDVLIHLPMAPVSLQPLEKDTLFPTMDQEEINRIMDEAIVRVPFAIGINNHMGSLMTADLVAMTRLMARIACYDFFYLDSRTSADSQAPVAAARYGVPLLTRQIFLDDVRTESAITAEWHRALRLARKKGQAIVIGHPYKATLAVLSKQLSQLPPDITLVKLHELLPARYDTTLLERVLISPKQTSDRFFYKGFGHSASSLFSPALTSVSANFVKIPWQRLQCAF